MSETIERKDAPYEDVNEPKPDGGRTVVENDQDVVDSSYIGHKEGDVTVKNN